MRYNTKMEPLVGQVFVSGGTPEYTYVSRDSERLEEKLERARYNSNVTVVSGITKSGKSILARKIFPPDEAVWIQGAVEGVGQHFWQRLLEQLGGRINYTKQETTTEGSTKSAGARLDIPGVGGIGGGGDIAQSREFIETTSSHGDLVWEVVKLLVGNKRPVVIDDFHLLPEDVRKGISYTAKELILDNVPIILLTIPRCREDVIKLAPELMGRVSIIKVPPWNEQELVEIARKGFDFLNVSVAPEIISKFVNESRQSPWLMQKFCLRLCDDEGVTQKSSDSRKITYRGNMDKFFHDVARDEPEAVYTSFVKGPTTSKERTKRNFKDGGEGDIYEAIAYALSRLLRQNGGSFLFQALSKELEKVLVDMPQSGEISRVLNQMSKIKMSGEDSDTLLTFDAQERKIYINDPYLAFYLIWGDFVELRWPQGNLHLPT